jgi:hopene-associated glycosyltransferase HpnB
VGAYPAVVAIVPARNEARTVARCLESLAQQDYPGALSIILVDDGSTDGTGAIAARALAPYGGARPSRILAAPPLAKGWTGKLAALQAGLDAARRFAPEAEYVWLTDADIAHGPRTLARLLEKAREGRDLVSLMVRLHCEGFWERLLIPAFVFFFQMLYPFPAVNAEPSRVGGAAGGCMLIRRAALDALGGFHAVRAALIDDCALAEALRRRGGLLWLGLAEESVSLRPYEGLSTLWQMVARTAYTQLRHSPRLLLGTLIGLGLTFLLPPLLVLGAPLHGDAAALALGGLSWALMAAAYRPTLRLYAAPRLYALSLPLAALLYAAMTLDSARAHWRGEGGRWKERDYNFG